MKISQGRNLAVGLRDKDEFGPSPDGRACVTRLSDKRARSEESSISNNEWLFSKYSNLSGKGSVRVAAPNSASMTNRSEDFVREAKFEPSRSRILNAMKARTKGMLAIHAACRRVEVCPTRKSFIYVVASACCVALLGSNSTDSVRVSSGQICAYLIKSIWYGHVVRRTA